MMLFRKIFVVLSLFLMCFYSQKTFASGSGGFRDETTDARAFGMGSAFVGEADTPAAVYYNPAGINQISSPEITVGDATIDPRGSFKGNGGITQNERVNEYNVPDFYAVVPVIPNKLTIGLDGGSYFGLGENWASNGPLRYDTTQAKLETVDDSLVAAYQLTDHVSLAASVDNDYIKADESKSLYNFGLGPDGTAELRGSDDAVGYRFATMVKINDQNQVGLMYRSRIDHDLTGKAILNGINPALEANYGANSTNLITPVQVKIALPQSVVLGYSLKPTAKWTINADLEWMDWSSTKYQTITYPNDPALQSATPSVPEDWHSAWSFSFGTQYSMTDHLRLRLGYYHHDKVVPSADFNPIIPDSSVNGYTTGFGYDLTKNLALDVSYGFSVYTSRDVTNATLAALPININGKYSQYQNIAIISLTYKF